MPWIQGGHRASRKSPDERVTFPDQPLCPTSDTEFVTKNVADMTCHIDDKICHFYDGDGLDILWESSFGGYCTLRVIHVRVEYISS